MEEALKRAAADTQFQFFLARLFGQFVTAVDGITKVHGYEWRGHMFVTGFTKDEQAPVPSQDSQHRSSPDF